MDRNQSFDRQLEEYLERNYEENAKFISSSFKDWDIFKKNYPIFCIYKPL